MLNKEVYMEALTQTDGLVVQQKKEWGEILTGFETKNKYAIYNTAGDSLYYAAEVGGNILLRLFLKAWRPFEIAVVKPDNQIALHLKSPFRFYFREIAVHDASGQLLGSIQRRFSILRRKYTVYDSQGQEICELFGPILHPWTFEIRENGEIFGKITKKWSGLLKEGFTDADNFGVTFPVDWPKEIKAILFGGVFLIDFVHFENKNNN
ncbi:MAG: scramblase [Planctomycetota bacterium]|nr:MAG: scramblase [Planctomycetota bacterium]